MLLVAYHADDEILRWWAIVGGLGALLVVALAAILAAQLPAGTATSRTAAVIALSLAGLAGVAMATRYFIFGVLLAAPALLAAVWIATSNRRPGDRRLTIAAFTAALFAFDLGTSAVAACGISDACLH